MGSLSHTRTSPMAVRFLQRWRTYMTFWRIQKKCMMLPHKKYVLKRCNRKPRNILNKTMKMNHKDFVSQRTKIGYSTFSERRPKNCVTRKCNKWIQCLCEKCENMELKIAALKDFCTLFTYFGPCQVYIVC